MTVKDLLELMHNSERILITDIETKEVLKNSYVGCMNYREYGELLEREVKAMQLCTDIWHKDYIARGLLPPDHGEAADIMQHDLKIAIYQQIFI